jgi:hypothetical protein
MPVAQTARLTCPACGVITTTLMPEDACQFFFQCPACATVLRPLAGDCCVFCSYADRPCPSKAAAGAPGGSESPRSDDPGRAMVRVGVVGVLLTVLCCFTPVGLLLLGAVGVGAAIGYLDEILWPLLAMFLGLGAYGLWRQHRWRSSRGAP